MAIEDTIKKYAIFGALVLPVALILVVWLLTSMPKTLDPPPQYDFIYSVNEPYYYATQLVEQDGKIVLKYLKRKGVSLDEKALPKLYLYTISDKQSHLIAYQVHGKFNEGDDWQILSISTSIPISFIPGSTSPDQYTYERRYRGGNGFPLFSYHSRNSHVIYLEDNVLTFSNKNHITFLGWLQSEDNHRAR